MDLKWVFVREGIEFGIMLWIDNLQEPIMKDYSSNETPVSWTSTFLSRYP